MSNKLHLAIDTATGLVDFLVLHGKLTELEGQFVFDRMTDSLQDLTEYELNDILLRINT